MSQIKFTLTFLIFISVNLYAAPIILPSAPGIESIEIDEQKATAIADTSYNSHDVHFLQMMIIHHDQALLMSRLAPSRTNSKNILDLAGRIDSSQEDEMLFMKSWLQDRNEPIHHMHNQKMMKMAGMASSKEINLLKAVSYTHLTLPTT